jgi:hypothetical protein
MDHSSQLKQLLIITLLVPVSLYAGMRGPFAPGFSMGTQGAVINGQNATGREPWTSASLCGDSAGFGVSLCGISYFGSVGTATGPDGIAEAYGGGWYARNGLVVKAAVSNLSALDVYFEQSGFVSLGIALPHSMRVGIEGAGYRTGVSIAGETARTSADLGLSAWVPWTWAALSLRVEHLTVNASGAEGGEAPLRAHFGIHTLANRFGGQGAVISVEPERTDSPVCFTVGEEYRITPDLAFQAAFSNNPILVSFGLALTINKSDFSLALVNHDRLGWSQGFAAGYGKQQ